MKDCVLLTIVLETMRSFRDSVGESFHIKVLTYENFPSVSLRGRKASETGIGNSCFLIIFQFYRVILCLPPAFYRGYTLNAHNYFNVGVSIVILVLYATIWLVFKRAKSQEASKVCKLSVF